MKMENSIYDKKRRVSDIVLSTFIQLSTLMSVALLVVIIGYICIRGIPCFKFDYLINTTSILKNTVGILPNILNTKIATKIIMQKYIDLFLLSLNFPHEFLLLFPLKILNLLLE